MTPTQSPLSRWAPAVLLLVALVAATAAFVLRGEARDRQAAADESQLTVDALETTRLQILISATAFAELTVQLEQLAGESRRPTNAEQLGTLERAAEELSTMVDEGRVPDAVVPIVIDVLDAADRATADPGDLWALEEIAYVSTTPSTFGTPETLPDRFLLASVLATSPSLVAIDALSLELAGTLDDLSPEAADYVESTASIVQEDPGWFGPELATPFVGGYLPGDLLEEVDPALLASLRDVADIGDVWEYDQWLIARLETDGSAPQTLADVVASARAAQSPLVGQLLGDVDAAVAEAAVDSPGSLLAIAWIVLAAISLAAVLAAAVVVFTRTRRLAAVAFGDPLTGTGNRHLLHQLEQQWAGDGGPPFAAVAVLDLDRFKMINDSWGHAAGDQVLRHVGRGLRQLADELGAEVDEAEVFRLGGDEFALVVAASTPQVEATLLQRISSIGGPVEVGDGEVVDVGLSVGAVSAAHPHDLADLLAAADLRAYEAKQQRRTPGVGAPTTDELRL